MGSYTRRQLLVLLGLVAAAGLGLAVGHWRRAHPELAARIEDFDRDPELTTAVLVPEPDSPPRPRALHRPAERVDVNRATETDLAKLPGMSPALAARIVAAREQDGPFVSVDDLGRIKRLGRARLERLRPFLSVDPAASSAPSADKPRGVAADAR